MTTMGSQITSLTIVYSIVYSDADQRKHQSSASLAFVQGIHRWPVNSPHKRPVTRKMFQFDDVVMNYNLYCVRVHLGCIRTPQVVGVEPLQWPTAYTDKSFSHKGDPYSYSFQLLLVPYFAMNFKMKMNITTNTGKFISMAIRFKPRIYRLFFG